MSGKKSKFCPKCGREYTNETKVCGACGEKLITGRPWILQKDVGTWTVLEKNTSDYDADQIIAQLSFYGIPAKKYYKGSAQYVSIFTGTTSIGVYVIVPESELERAREILGDESAVEDEDFDWESAGDVWKEKP